MKELAGLTPFDYLNILWRRRWYAVIVFLLIGGGVVAVANLLPDLYISSSMISVESPSMPRDYVRPSDASSPTQQISTAIQRIKSRSFIVPLIQDFGLQGYGTSEEFLMDDAVDRVRNHIKAVSTSENTLTISYTATNPQLAQEITQRIVEMLIQFGSSNRRSLAADTYDFLEKQAQENYDALKKQEEKIKRFRSAHMGRLPEYSQQNADALKQLKKELEETENELDALQVLMKSLDIRAQERQSLGLWEQDLYIPDSTPSSISGMNSESTPTPDAELAKKEAELKELKVHYLQSHPDVIRLQNEVDALKQRLNQRAAGAASDKSTSTPFGEADIDTLDVDLAQIELEAEIYRNDIQKLEKKRESLASQIQMNEDSANMAPELEAQLSDLDREREILLKQYQISVNDRDQARLTLELEQGDTGTYSIIDEANFPEKPDSPDRVRIALMGLLAGLVMGVGASLGRELLDSTLSTEEEAAAVLKMPVLVSVHEISKREARRHAIKKNIA